MRGGFTENPKEGALPDRGGGVGQGVGLRAIFFWGGGEGEAPFTVKRRPVFGENALNALLGPISLRIPYFLGRDT